MDNKGNLYIIHDNGTKERTEEAWKRLEAEINQEKLTILNRDGTTTEVDPVKMWTPTDDTLNDYLTGVSEPTAEEPVYPQEPQVIRPNRHERRKAAALARKVKK